MPLTIAEKLRENHKDKQYREKLAKYRKLTAGDKFEALELPKELTKHTYDKLVAAGFRIETVTYKDYIAYKISW